MPAGEMLKSLRKRRNITVREVEQASRRIAHVRGDKQFYISNGWLARLESGHSEPSMWKLFSLSLIYDVNLLDLLRLYNIDVNQKEKYEPVAPDRSSTGLSITCSANGDGADRHIIDGHLGLTDFTMYPMIRPGALLRIDTRQNKLVTCEWRSEYERPIYFVELRGGFACGWCELHGSQLLIIPHPSPFATVRSFNYPREAEIVGRIIGYSTSCIDEWK